MDWMGLLLTVGLTGRTNEHTNGLTCDLTDCMLTYGRLYGWMDRWDGLTVGQTRLQVDLFTNRTASTD